MKKCKTAACIVMILTAAMVFLPFYHVSLPVYFESNDTVFSGARLVKIGIRMTDSKMEEKVEGIRSLIKDCDELDDVYQALGKASKLVTKVKVYVLVSVCMPCILLLIGAAAGLLARTKNGCILPLALNAAAFLVEGITGFFTLFTFYQWKDKLIDGLGKMKSISTGISFLDTLLDAASAVVTKHLDKIKLQLQAGWFLFMILALAGLICWAVVLMQKQEAG